MKTPVRDSFFQLREILERERLCEFERSLRANPELMTDVAELGTPLLLEIIDLLPVERLRWLVAEGVDVNARNEEGDTAAIILIRSIGSGLEERSCVEKIRGLIDVGCDINLYGFGGLAPLHVAAIDGRELVAEFLLSSGADIDLRSEHDGDTAVILAARHGQFRVYEMLVASGANMHINSNLGDTANRELQLAKNRIRKYGAATPKLLKPKG